MLADGFGDRLRPEPQVAGKETLTCEAGSHSPRSTPGEPKSIAQMGPGQVPNLHANCKLWGVAEVGREWPVLGPYDMKVFFILPSSPDPFIESIWMRIHFPRECDPLMSHSRRSASGSTFDSLYCGQSYLSEMLPLRRRLAA
eukprot:CAMPEP_0181439448 /NCGR_PEP_ID=MMETSP1110-20121109/22432_1 /TAXON_ID=174948 /ORGANISM="Symbiodinium sp., Strain CCMP421" /LENGTH=141 /DNA_ID=CAMNT_0023563171 /DNA_START=151 /DNA_END=574 /DNA_ORIENTATION=+